MRTFRLGPATRAGISDRSGGVSAEPHASLNLSVRVGDDPGRVAENRRRAADGLGLVASQVVWMEQVHGAEVAVVEDLPGGPVQAADALVTRRRDVTLAVLVADCVPVLLADESAGVVAVAHAGRRGVAAGVVPATLATMVGLGAVPGNVTAVLGPAIGGCCYEVPAQLRAEVAAAVPATSSLTRRGTPALDLPAGVLAQLRESGVRRCSRPGPCTMEHPAYFSHRRDGVTGRFAGYLWLA